VALTQIVPTCTEIQNPIFGNVAVSCPVNRAIPSGGTEGAPSFLVEPQSAGTITVWATVSPVSGETDTNSSNNRLENTTTTNPASAFAGMVAFVSDRDGSRDLYVKNLATGAITQLTDDAATEANPVWSPDGTRIAYDKTTNSLGTGSDIFVINANGTSETRLTSNLDSFHPTWSPDGTELAYQDRSDGDWEIMVLNVASPSTRRKLTDNTGQDLEPDWNGGSILFRRTNLVSGSTINTMDATDGGNVVEVVALGALNAPAFSPDGTRIVYERRAGTAWSIEVLTLGGGTVVVESDGVRNTGPAFSPDGTQVIFAKNPDLASQVYNLWVTAADGSTTSQSVETSAGNDLHPSWR
jgi:Tol biopolymer transport system component